MTKMGNESVGPIMALAVVAALGACAETKEVAMKEPPPASAVLPDAGIAAERHERRGEIRST